MVTLTGFADEISADLDTQLDVLESESISYLELRRVWGKNILDLNEAEIKQVKKQLEERGFKVSAIASPIGKIKITDDFSAHLEDFQRAIYLAKYFNAPFVRIFSFYIPKEESPNKYRGEVLQRMKKLTNIAEKEDIVLLHENEKRVYGENGERCLELLKACSSDHLRCAFDPANFVQCGIRPMKEAFFSLERYISYIHIKDALMQSGKVVPAGQGDGELRELLNKLKEKQYSGFLSIEPHLSPKDAFQGYSKEELFVIASRALKDLLNEGGIKWS